MRAESILLVEDDPQLGAMLREELMTAGYVCWWAPDGAGAMRIFQREAPDLVLLDLMLPDRSGFSVLAEIRQNSQVPVVVLTARVQGEDKIQGFDLGADDYVTKPFWNHELLARIRARLRRPNFVAAKPETFSFGKVNIDVAARTVEVGAQRVHFTAVEFELLCHLVERPGKTVLKDALTEKLVQDADAGQTLHTHVSRIRKKLGSDGEQIQTVWGLGYRFDPPLGHAAKG